jgi:hypothetical protein
MYIERSEGKRDGEKNSMPSFMIIRRPNSVPSCHARSACDKSLIL